MELALYLLPVTLGDTPIETVLPPYNKEIILGIRYFIVEDVIADSQYYLLIIRR